MYIDTENSFHAFFEWRVRNKCMYGRPWLSVRMFELKRRWTDSVKLGVCVMLLQTTPNAYIFISYNQSYRHDGRMILSCRCDVIGTWNCIWQESYEKYTAFVTFLHI
jgi:hypothetical protein